ncbi:hypothetical protein T484DRAFT_1640908, partial [Baffinella frigidus]
LNHSLTQSLTHSLTHSLAHSLPHSLTHSLTHSLAHSRSDWVTDGSASRGCRGVVKSDRVPRSLGSRCSRQGLARQRYLLGNNHVPLPARPCRSFRASFHSRFRHAGPLPESRGDGIRGLAFTPGAYGLACRGPQAWITG